MKSIAILGPTASGKTSLAIDLALSTHAHILSLDSLSVYQEINIASAKPSLQERKGIVHYGMDVLLPSEPFNVTLFFKLYQEAKEACLKEKRHLIIVGGTGFYLKALLEGLSESPKRSNDLKAVVEKALCDLEACYRLIQKEDPAYASNIASNDRYRIQKWLEIFHLTHLPASCYQMMHKRSPIIEPIPLFELSSPKDHLAQRIRARTRMMLKEGLIEEVFDLEKRYTRSPQCMGAIGIKEVLAYFDGHYSLERLEEAITTHTLQLAKRQRTFNTSQFKPHPKEEADVLYHLALQSLKEF